MMKRTVLLGILAGILLSKTAFAGGNLNVTDKNVFIYTGKDSGVFSARIENDGDAPAGVDSGKLVLFSENDDILETADYITAFPSRLVLNPGEYTYVREFLWTSDRKNQTIGDMKFSVGVTENGREAERILCESSYEISGSDSFDNYLYISFTNEAEQIRYGYYLVAALYDTEGNLIYVDNNQYEKVGVHPGSTVTIGLYLDNDTIEYFEANNIEIGSSDALVYYIEK